MVEVYTASDVAFVYPMKANLEAAEISVQIGNENLQGMLCFGGMVPNVLVLETQGEQAKQGIAGIQYASANTTDIDEAQ